MGKKKKERVKKYDKLIKKHIRKRNAVKINRKFVESEENIYSLILGMSKNFLLLQKIDEFKLNGYTIIKKDQFDSIRYNKFDKASKRILIKEGVIKKDYGLNFDIALNDWKTIFTTLKNENPYVIVECENLKKPSFTIGPIEKRAKKEVHIRNFDATGKFDKNVSKISYNDITCVSFRDNYIEIFKKYLKKS